MPQLDFSFPQQPPQNTTPTRKTSARQPPVHTHNNSASHSALPSQPKPSRPTSHHRRNSSVSTRRESAEIMGITFQENTQTEDGNTFQIRQRALWALEGKGKPSSSSLNVTPASTNSLSHGYAKVEIPEWTTPDEEPVQFDWSDSGSNSAKPLSFSITNNSLVGKRDSLGKTLSLQTTSSSTGELHTLVEVDEEAPEDDSARYDADPAAIEPDYLLATPVLSTPRMPTVIPATPSPSTTPSSSRPRPPSLTLRPLSLVAALPTASQTPSSISPSPRISSLKSLTLPPGFTHTSATALPLGHAVHRRYSLQAGLIAPSPSVGSIHPRQCSISYKRASEVPSYPRRSMSPPTPDSSPSTSSSDIFFNNYAGALLSRIASLEAALSSRPGSMSLPLTPDTAISVPGSKSAHSPSASANSTNDELVTLVADLKAERDELNSDVQGWRTRCADLQRAAEAIKRLLTEERRELDAAKERVGVLESDVQTRDGVIDRLKADIVARDQAIAALEITLAVKEEGIQLANEEIEAHQSSIRILDSELNAERAALAGDQLHAEGVRLGFLKEKRAWESERTSWLEERKQLDEQLRSNERKIRELEDRLAQATAGTTPKSRPSSYPAPSSSRTSPAITPLNFKFPLTNASTPRQAEVSRARASLDSEGSSVTQIEEFPPYPYSYTIASSEQYVLSPTKASGFGAGFKFGGRSSTPSNRGSFSSVKSNSPGADGTRGVLGVVAEEEEDYESEEDALRGYEDEDDSFEAPHGEFDDESGEDDTTSEEGTRIPILAPAAVIEVPAPSTPKHKHRRSASMVQTWKFPSPASMTASARRTPKPIEIDNFFACLEDKPIITPPAVAAKKEKKRLPSGCPAFWLNFDEPDPEDDAHTVVPDFVSSSSFTLETVQEEETTASELDTLDGEDSEDRSYCSTPAEEQTVTVVKTLDGLPVLKLGFNNPSTSDDLGHLVLSPMNNSQASLFSKIELGSSTHSITSPPLLTISSPNAERAEPLPCTPPRSPSPTPTDRCQTTPRAGPLSRSSSSPVPKRTALEPLLRRFTHPQTSTPTTTTPPLSIPAMTVPHVDQSMNSVAPFLSNDTSSTMIVKPIPSAVTLASRLSLQTLTSIISWTPKAPKPPLCVITEDDDDELAEERRQLMEKQRMKERGGWYASSSQLVQNTNMVVLPASSTPSPAKAKTKHVDPLVMRERLRLQLEREGRLTLTKSGGIGYQKTNLPLGSAINKHPAVTSSQGPCFRCSQMDVLEL